MSAEDREPQYHPRGSLPGLVWPSLPTGAQASRLALLFQFERTQWWPAEELRAWQLRQARVLLAHAQQYAPYYRDRLTEAGFSTERPLTEEVWQRIPILGREDVLDQETALQATRLPKGHGRVTLRTSSGSTGRPVRVKKTEAGQLYWYACTDRDSLWQRRDLSLTMALIRGRDPKAGYPDGQRGKSWGNMAFASGPGALLRADIPVAQQAEWLARVNPHYLQTPALNLGPLLEHCRATGLRPPRLRDVSTFAGQLHPELREICREVWGVPIADMYSAEEVGYMALQCPDEEVYHVQAESVIVEILDAEGRPCPPGARGRVIVTPLHNFAMPLLRYEVGDEAVLGGPCPCGRGLPVIERIVGRIRNRLTLPTGELVAPVFVHDLMRDLPVIQFQIAQLAPDHLEARIVPQGSFGAEEEARLTERMLERLPAVYRITFLYLEEIPRSPSGKYLDFKSEITEEPDA